MHGLKQLWSTFGAEPLCASRLYSYPFFASKPSKYDILSAANKRKRCGRFVGSLTRFLPQQKRMRRPSREKVKLLSRDIV